MTLSIVSFWFMQRWTIASSIDVCRAPRIQGILHGQKVIRIKLSAGCVGSGAKSGLECEAHQSGFKV